MRKNIINRILTVALTGILFGATLTGCGEGSQNADTAEVRVIHAATSANPKVIRQRAYRKKSTGQRCYIYRFS